MYIKNPYFTENEFSLLKNNFKKIGEAHGVSGQYVGAIASGHRAVNSEKARTILASLQKLLKSIKSL
jgi:hypothetical protein